MLYNSPISYAEPNIGYVGSLVISAPSLSNPIVLNNVGIIFGGLEDYSNYTTIAVISMDINSTGVVSIEVLDENVSALISASTISVGHGEVSILS